MRSAAAIVPLAFTLALSVVGATGRPGPSFTADIAPLLQQRCVLCHGSEKSKGHYRLDTFASLLTPGSSGAPTVVHGRPDASHLYQLIVATNADDRMPQNAPALLPQEIETVRSWIASGAMFDGPSSNALLAAYAPTAARGHPPERYPRPWPVTAMAFVPGDREIVVSGYHEVTFWDALTGQLTTRTEDMPERVRALCWQPGGARLAVAGGAPGRAGEVLLIDRSHEERIELGRARDEVLCAAFSPDGEHVAFGGADNRVRVVSIASRREVLVLEQHSDWVHALAFSPDGTRLASSSRDRTARVYDAASGETLCVFRDHDAAVESIGFDSKGVSVFSGGADRRVRSWDSVDAGRARTFAKFDLDITALLGGGDSLFIGLGDGRVAERRLSNGAEVCNLPGSGDRVTALALNTESPWLATGSDNGTVRLWDSRSGEKIAEFVAAPGLRELASIVSPGFPSGGSPRR